MSKKSSIPNHVSLWSQVINIFSDFDIESFRRPGGQNERLATWSSMEKSTRYYKSLMYEFSIYLNDIINNDPTLEYRSIKPILNNIKRKNLGDPTTIFIADNEVSLDYLLAAEEIIFLNKTLLQSSTVCEIGAGYGRSAHSIISNYNIEKYIVVDLPEMLEISKTYLKTVLPKRKFQKLTFVADNDLSSVPEVDLVLNIASMQEMPRRVVLNYLGWIANNSSFFFTKNAMGKYCPDSIDLTVDCMPEYESVLSMGLITEEFSLFDTNEIQKAKQIYQHSFCPKDFRLIKEQRGFGQWSLFGLALFAKNSHSINDP